MTIKKENETKSKKDHQFKLKINVLNTNSNNINIESKGKLPIIPDPGNDKKKNKRNNLSNPKMENKFLLTEGWKKIPKIIGKINIKNYKSLKSSCNNFMPHKIKNKLIENTNNIKDNI